MRRAIATMALRRLAVPCIWAAFAIASASTVILTPQDAWAQSVGAPPADSQSTAPAWQSSPFHGVIGGDGRVIPCRCRYQGRTYRLGEKVCMRTHLGTVMTECDLQQNNTSWVPTEEACDVS